MNEIYTRTGFKVIDIYYFDKVDTYACLIDNDGLTLNFYKWEELEARQTA